MDLASLFEWAKYKGIDVLGTGDFTHPQWFSEMKSKLKPSETSPGLYEYGSGGAKFLLSSEISSIYSQGGKCRRIHNIVFAPSLEVVAQIIDELTRKGANLKADGRPIVGLHAPEIVELVMGISRDCEVVPAHAWTPHFSVFGSESGFDSVEECFGDTAKYIHALETGLSSDPPMNWRLSALDKYTLISNSDCHSAAKIGREANVFELPPEKVSYFEIIDAIRKKDKKRFKMTYEFFPEEGKYHVDGHRNCNVRMTPEEAMKHKNICPVCRKPLTIGVLHRVAELADRPEGFVPENSIPFEHLVPLREIIAKVMGKGEATKGVAEEYFKIIKAFGNEFNALHAERSELVKNANEKIADAIARVNAGRIKVIPGYDGEYGIVDVTGEEYEKMKGREEKVNAQRNQKKLGDF